MNLADTIQTIRAIIIQEEGYQKGSQNVIMSIFECYRSFLEPL